MAFIKEIQIKNTSVVLPAAYHRIDDIRILTKQNLVIVTVAIFESKESSQVEGIDPVETSTLTLTFDELGGKAGLSYASIYTAIKETVEFYSDSVDDI